jgi:hypothetical protein
MPDPCAFAACIVWDGRMRPENGDGVLCSVNYAETRKTAREALLRRSHEVGFMDGEVAEGYVGVQAWLGRVKDLTLA